MKKLYMLNLFIAIANVALCQSLCDDKICIVKSDIYNKPTEQQISQLAIDHKRAIEESGHIFDISCEYPSFWFYNKDGKKVVKTAKSIGSTSYVAGDQRCDIIRSPKFVQIQYHGDVNYAVDDYNGDAVFLDKCFFHLISDKDYWCYGLPIEPTKYVNCKICGTVYKTQKFKDIDSEVRTLYNLATKCSNGKNHDNLELEDIGKCEVTKGRTIPTE